MIKLRELTPRQKLEAAIKVMRSGFHSSSPGNFEIRKNEAEVVLDALGAGAALLVEFCEKAKQVEALNNLVRVNNQHIDRLKEMVAMKETTIDRLWKTAMQLQANMRDLEEDVRKTIPG